MESFPHVCSAGCRHFLHGLSWIPADQAFEPGVQVCLRACLQEEETRREQGQFLPGTCHGRGGTGRYGEHRRRGDRHRHRRHGGHLLDVAVRPAGHEYDLLRGRAGAEVQERVPWRDGGRFRLLPLLRSGQQVAGRILLDRHCLRPGLCRQYGTGQFHLHCPDKRLPHFSLHRRLRAGGGGRRRHYRRTAAHHLPRRAARTVHGGRLHHWFTGHRLHVRRPSALRLPHDFPRCLLDGGGRRRCGRNGDEVCHPVWRGPQPVLQ